MAYRESNATYYYYIFDETIPSDCGQPSTTHSIYILKWNTEDNYPQYRFVTSKTHNLDESIETITCIQRDKMIELLKNNKIIKIKKEIEWGA